MWLRSLKVRIKKAQIGIFAMFDLIEFRKLLGPQADGLTDKEVQRIMDIECGFVDAMFDLWLRERNQQPAIMTPDTS